MRNYKLPIGKPEYIMAEGIKLADFYGFIDVVVECDNSYIRFSPKKLDNSLIGVIYPYFSLKN